MKLFFTLAIVALASCDSGRALQGTRGPCSTASGEALGCDEAEIVSADDACWRLVECGVIPLKNPEDNPDAFFDWARCVRYVESLSDARFGVVLACVDAASCDDLKTENSPTRTNDLPLCLQFGDT